MESVKHPVEKYAIHNRINGVQGHYGIVKETFLPSYYTGEGWTNERNEATVYTSLECALDAVELLSKPPVYDAPADGLESKSVTKRTSKKD